MMKGDIGGAERALTRMAQKGVAANVARYNPVIVAYARAWDIAGAERVWVRVDETGVRAGRAGGAERARAQRCMSPRAGNANGLLV